MDIEELKRGQQVLAADLQTIAEGVKTDWRKNTSVGWGWLADETAKRCHAAIVAKLEAAQRLRDAVRPFCKIAEGTVGRIPTERLSGSNWHELWKAAKAFDKETA